MRLIQLLVNAADLGDVREILDDEGVDYIVTREEITEPDAIIVEFPLPTQAVDKVLERLSGAGVDADEYTVIANAETARTPGFEELERRFVAGEEETDQISNDEIVSKARALTPGARTYYAMTLLSAVVATAGLLLNSPAIVVGSMVIAPQVGSALTASIGGVLGREQMVADGLRDQALSLTVVILAATTLGVLLQSAFFVPSVLDVQTVGQISNRISPGLLAFAVGVCAGSAGAFGLATEFPVSLVGVAVAAAIVPAAAAVGVGLAWAYPAVAVGAFVLLLINTVAINVAAAATFWYLGYRPAGWEERGRRRVVASTLRSRTAMTVLVVGVVALAVSGALVGQQMAFENDVKTSVERLLSEEYDELDLETVQATFSDPRTDVHEVRVVVSRPADEPYPSLPDELAGAISERTDQEVVVTVEFTERRKTSKGSSEGASTVRPRDRSPVPTGQRASTSVL